MSYDYITSLPPAQKAYHEFGEILKSGQSSNKNSYRSRRSAKSRRSSPAAVVHIGEREQEEIFYVYDRRAKLKKL
tara:strand:- start:2320 stop:2544 length:225 start_codon:yes stop_codon:yes gene_type:complete